MKWHLVDQSTAVSRAFMSACVLVLWPILALMTVTVSGGNMGPGPGPGSPASSAAPLNGVISTRQLTNNNQHPPLNRLFNHSDSSHKRSKVLGLGEGKTSASLRHPSDGQTPLPSPVVDWSSPVFPVDKDKMKTTRKFKDNSKVQLLSSGRETSLVQVQTTDDTENGEPVKVRPRSRRQCPSCQPPPDSASETERQLADTARLESIKRQILIKLGLQAKPNVSTVPSRDFILETLLRAEESLDSESRPANGRRIDGYTDPEVETTTTDGSVEDDFFGKTSEIIAFAEQGKN